MLFFFFASRTFITWMMTTTGSRPWRMTRITVRSATTRQSTEKLISPNVRMPVQVPSEAFRLGAKRVFFRAGQIAVLHKILNETPQDKVPWVLSRLKLALANRKLARIAAEEAEVINRGS